MARKGRMSEEKRKLFVMLYCEEKREAVLHRFVLP